VLTKSMEQNADGSYRIAVSAVSGDLQTASCYIINVTVPAAKLGDIDGNGMVNITDVMALINYLINGNAINEQNADMNNDGKINITDTTMLISSLLNN